MVNLLGVVLIALIVWWFWLYKPAEVTASESNTVIVVENGTYQPAHISALPDQPLDITFLRKDASPCAEMVLFPALEISEQLPLNKSKTIHLPAMAAGDYDFHCQMQMYRGQLKVK